MHRLAAVAAAAVGVWLLVVGSAYAQQGTGELRGRVVDAQNAVLPGVTASVGGVGFERARVSVVAAFGAADEAMYAAKREGKNRVVVHEAGGP